MMWKIDDLFVQQVEESKTKKEAAMSKLYQALKELHSADDELYLTIGSFPSMDPRGLAADKGRWVKIDTTLDVSDILHPVRSMSKFMGIDFGDLF